MKSSQIGFLPTSLFMFHTSFYFQLPISDKNKSTENVDVSTCWSVSKAVNTFVPKWTMYFALVETNSSLYYWKERKKRKKQNRKRRKRRGKRKEERERGGRWGAGVGGSHKIEGIIFHFWAPWVISLVWTWFKSTKLKPLVDKKHLGGDFCLSCRLGSQKSN